MAEKNAPPAEIVRFPDPRIADMRHYKVNARGNLVSYTPTPGDLIVLGRGPAPAIVITASAQRIYLARDRDGALDVYWTEPDVDVETGRWMEPVTQESLDAEELLEELVPAMHCREFIVVAVQLGGDGG